MPAASTRTCIGCRRPAAAASLVRLVVRDGRVEIAAAGRGARSGRGASIHPTEACARAAIKQRAFGRAFRRAVDGPGESAAEVAAFTLAVVEAGARAAESLGSNDTSTAQEQTGRTTP